jgi:proteasome lid subunit RPN8/RPN11
MDSLTVKNRSFNKILEQIKLHCERYFAVECCGFIGKKNQTYIVQFVTNRSPNPNSFFCVDPLDYLKFKNEYEFISLIHSHICEDETFSKMDVANSEAICLPSIVYSITTKKFAIYEPKDHEVDVNTLNKVKGYL